VTPPSEVEKRWQMAAEAGGASPDGPGAASPFGPSTANSSPSKELRKWIETRSKVPARCRSARPMATLECSQVTPPSVVRVDRGGRRRLVEAGAGNRPTMACIDELHPLGVWRRLARLGPEAPPSSVRRTYEAPESSDWNTQPTFASTRPMDLMGALFWTAATDEEAFSEGTSVGCCTQT